MKNIVFPLINEHEYKLPFYLAGVGCRHTQEHILRPKGHPSFQWIQCHRGEGELILDGMTCRVRKDQGMLLFPDEPHEYYAIDSPWEVDWMILGGSQVENFVKDVAGIRKSGVFFVSHPDIILSRMRKALDIAQAGSLVRGHECSSIVYEILLNLSAYLSKENDNSRLQQYNRLKPVLDYLQEHYSEVVTLKQLADIAGITPQHFCTLFKSIMGARVFEYINNVRINKSKELMLDRKNMQVKEISGLVGFNDVSYFCSVFRSMEKISPGEFKKLHEGEKNGA